MEVVMGLAVMALVIPSILGALAISGSSSMDSRAESRAAWMVDVCLSEWERAIDEEACWVFGEDGHLIGAVDRRGYENGVSVDGRHARYLALVIADGDDPSCVKIEYPSALPAVKREIISFQLR